MTTTLVKRLIQMTLLGIVLGSSLSIADSSSRLEPISAPVPLESTSDTDDQRRSGTENASFERRKDGFEQELRSAFGEREDEIFNWSLLVPLFAITFVFGGPIALIIVLAILHYRSKNRQAQLKAELTLKALETGRDLPQELEEQNFEETLEDHLRKGVKNIGLGIGMVAGISLLVGFDIGALGFILVGIGGAQLVLWKLEKSKQQKDPA